MNFEIDFLFKFLGNKIIRDTDNNADKYQFIKESNCLKNTLEIIPPIGILDI